MAMGVFLGGLSSSDAKCVIKPNSKGAKFVKFSTVKTHGQEKLHFTVRSACFINGVKFATFSNLKSYIQIRRKKILCFIHALGEQGRIYIRGQPKCGPAYPGGLLK